jgi:hypothetical protein
MYGAEDYSPFIDVKISYHYLFGKIAIILRLYIVSKGPFVETSMPYLAVLRDT